MRSTIEQIARTMRSASFYPHPVDAVDVKETHISMVFLTGSKVYKIKKPVALGFLDFSTLARRKHYCLEEMKLNRRLSTDIYLDVVPITADRSGYRLNGSGEVVEYSVCMRQLPPEQTMQRRLSENTPRNKIDTDMLDGLARQLVMFYKRTATGGLIDAMGEDDIIARNCEENFEQTAPFRGDILDAAACDQVQQATGSYLQLCANRFAERIAMGKIRDGHGDLRPDHIYFTPHGIQIIDCIEFNERLRYVDTICDLAFLLMEMDRLGHGPTSRELFRAYLHHSDDRHAFHLLAFYKCYRAMVRVKVNCLRMKQSDVDASEREKLVGQAGQYLDLARHYAARFDRPVVWVVCGMIASGKSTVAGALAEALDISRYNSDQIRKTITKETGPTAFGEGIYSKEATNMVYDRLRFRARTAVEKQRSVVLDATYGRRKHRDAMRKMAERYNARLLFVECACNEAILERRLMEREREPHPLSDARLEHLAPLKAGYEELNEVDPEHYLRIDTRQTLKANIDRILAQFA